MVERINLNTFDSVDSMNGNIVRNEDYNSNNDLKGGRDSGPNKHIMASPQVMASEKHVNVNNNNV